MRDIKQAMILSAGLGKRMKELTQEIPKPMLTVDGVPLIERHLTYLHQNNIKNIVINTFYKAELLEDFINNLAIAKKLNIKFCREENLLDVGGGIKNALSIFKQEPFFVLNSDAIFIDKDPQNSALKQLESKWQPDKMKILILLAEKDKSYGFRDKGDFDMNEQGQVSLNKEDGLYIHSGMRIMDYRAFQEFPEKVLSMISVYNATINEKKLYGTVYLGRLLHIGDNQAYKEYNKNLLK